MRISDWSSDVCSSDLPPQLADVLALQRAEEPETHAVLAGWTDPVRGAELPDDGFDFALSAVARQWPGWVCEPLWHDTLAVAVAKRSEEHTSELQSLMRISYAVFCWKKKQKIMQITR